MTDPLAVAEIVRKACIEAALAAYEDAGISGLCAEGRWEAAVGAMQSLDLRRIPDAAVAPAAPASKPDPDSPTAAPGAASLGLKSRRLR